MADTKSYLYGLSGTGQLGIFSVEQETRFPVLFLD
jgi:hypothetical protein